MKNKINTVNLPVAGNPLIVDGVAYVPVCGYSASCNAVPTTAVNMGPAVGELAICDDCAALYERLNAPRN